MLCTSSGTAHALRLSDLYRLRAVDRFRPLAAAGSSPYHWVLDQAGAEVLAAEDGVPLARLGYRRDRALDIAFSPRLAHTRGANGVFTALARAARCGDGELACWWSERRCAALWGDLARPDGYGLWRDPGGQATDFFLEYDTGSEDLPRLAAKLTGYRELAGRTQIATPVLFWLASGPRREHQFRALLAAAGPVPGVPVATATPASAQATGGPAGAAWLPAGQPGPRLRPGQLAAARRRYRAGLAPAHPQAAASYRVRRQAGAEGGTMTGRRLAACAVAAVLAVGCAACTSWQPPPAPRHSHAASSPPATPGPAGTPALAAILPFSPSRLQAAAVLAGQFTASWDSWSWRQSAAAWLARLLPLTAAELRPALAQAAGTPGVLAQRDATRQAATAAPAAEQIRDLTPGSVTVAVTVRQVISSTSGTTQAVASFAVTLTPADAGWAVWDIEPASAGNS